jgi:hypothetical protein
MGLLESKDRPNEQAEGIEHPGEQTSTTNQTEKKTAEHPGLASVVQWLVDAVVAQVGIHAQVSCDGLCFVK